MKKLGLVVLILSVILLFILAVTALFIGSGKISPLKVFYSIFSDGKTTTVDTVRYIILNLRLPRIIAAIAVGGILSLAGLVYQTLIKNPLAEPYTLGVSGGASFFAALVIFINSFTQFKLHIMPFALIGGAITLAVIITISSFKKNDIFTLIFTGIAISYIFSALLTLLLSLLGNRSYDVLIWMFGSFQNISFNVNFYILIGSVLPVFVIMPFFASILDKYYFSDELVHTMGVRINLVRIVLLSIVSLATVIAVSICGVIGFVGLIVPHLARLIFGSKHILLIPSVIVMGGGLLLISDTIARTVVSLFSEYGKELPVGVITSIIGSVVFLYFLLKLKKENI